MADKIGADAMPRAGDLPDGVVDVIAEGVPALIAIEQRRKDAQRQRCRHEQRIALQRRQDHVAELVRDGRTFGQLLVLLGARRLRAGGHFAVNPLGLVEQLTRARHLFGAQEIGNRQQHGFLQKRTVDVRIADRGVPGL